MLEINNLKVKVSDKIILKDLNLQVKPGEIHVIMGPNGVGKSTLSAAIMGNPRIEIVAGELIFEGEKINEMPVEQRARKGIFLAMQYPSQLEGVSNLQFLKTIVNTKTDENMPLFDLYDKVEKEKRNLQMPSDYLRRMVNSDFSGGEKKRNEIMQLKMLEPKLVILDEIDSGLDVDSLKLITQEIKNYYHNYNNVSILIITHYTKILEYIKPNYVHIMRDGKIIKTGALQLAYDIEKRGYYEGD